MKKVVYPTGAQVQYTYSSYFKNCGISGMMRFYKVTQVSGYNTKTYQYRYENTGEYDGYPQYYSESTMPDSYVIKTKVNYLNDFNNNLIYTYNKRLLCTSILDQGNNHKKEIINQYDMTTKLLTKRINRVYRLGYYNSYEDAVEKFEYDTGNYRDIVKYWDIQTQWNPYYGYMENNEHQTTYVYNPIYHYVVGKTYKKDVNTTIYEEYVPSADNKVVEYANVYENSVMKKKTQYSYDQYGNVIEERKYKDNWTDYISVKYSYDDNIPARNGQFNGGYLTRIWYEDVRDADSNLVAALPGNNAGVVDQVNKYDWFGNLIEARDGEGNITSYSYDKLGRKTMETHPDGSYASWNYNTADNSVTYTNENGKQFQNDYDPYGHLMFEKDLTSGQILMQYTYDTRGRLKTESNNGNKAVTTYTYISDGHVAKKEVKDLYGILAYREDYRYEEWDFPKYIYKDVISNINGANTEGIEYITQLDKLGRVLYERQNHLTDNVIGYDENDNEIYEVAHYYTSYEYDYLGNRTGTRMRRHNYEDWPEEYTTKTEYDFAGRPVRTYNIFGDYSSSEYDALGRKVKDTDINGNKSNPQYSTLYTYDDMGRLIKEEIPFENINGTIYYSVKKYYYDKNGNIVKELVSRNIPCAAAEYSKTTYEYNSRNMLTKIITYTPVTGSTDNSVPVNYTQYYYDAAGNKIRMYTGLSSPLTINGLDNITPGSDTDYSVTKYEYNQFNQLVKMIDPLGMYETYTYDYNGNMTGKTDRNGDNTVITYNTLNQVASREVQSAVSSRVAWNAFTYGLTGQISTSRVLDLDNTIILTSYTYDDIGRTESIHNSKESKYFKYDVDGNVVYEEIYFNNATGSVKNILSKDYIYDKMNRLQYVYDGNILLAVYEYYDNGNLKKVTYLNGNTTEYEYNLANKLKKLTNKNNGVIISEYTYTYYLNGFQASENDSVNGVTTYVYDGLGRLASVTEPGNTSTSYQYDDYNNRSTMTISGGSNPGITTYVYDKNNRLLTETHSLNGTTSYTYDNNGNQISKGTNTYKYNGFNQLIEANENGTLVNYSYNADGFRMQKRTPDDTIRYIWQGDQIAAEIFEGGNAAKVYVRGTNLILSKVFPANEIYNYNNTYNKTYYLYNGHGDVAQLTDDRGNVIKNYDYDAFGNEKTADTIQVNGEIYYADVNGDGKPDLISIVPLQYSNSGMVYVGLNNGNGFDLWTWASDADVMNFKDVLEFADVNGDGKDDLIACVDRNKQNIWSIHVALSNGTGFNFWTWERSLTNPKNLLYTNSYARFGDVNGDGKTDLIMCTIGFPNSYAYVGLSNGTGFNLWTSTDTTVPSVSPYVADVNADNKDDIVMNTSYLYSYISNGSSFPYKWQTSGIVFNNGAEMCAGDVNGDNKDDVIARGNNSIYLGLSNGTGFQTWTWTSASNIIDYSSKIYAGDVNGDGKDDVIVRVGSAGGAEGAIRIALSTGTGFNIWTSSTAAGFLKPSEKILLEDVNGDGKVDLTIIGTTVRVLLSDGTGFNVEMWNSGTGILTLEDPNPFRYSGEYFDKETGTYYLRARYYSPRLGRFISEDSYWGRDNDPLSLNLYVYCTNNPVNFWDPSGHKLTENDRANLSLIDQLKVLYYTFEYQMAELFAKCVYTPLYAIYGYASIEDAYARMNYYHMKVGELRSKYDPSYFSWDDYDYTHGGVTSGFTYTDEYMAYEREQMYNAINFALFSIQLDMPILPKGTSSSQLAADDIQFSDKFSKPAYKNQITERGWTNQKIADTINNPVKVGTSVNKYTGNSVTTYYIDDVHYVAVDDVTRKIIQVADLNKADWLFDLTK